MTSESAASRRKVYVMVSLVGVMCLTSLLLLAMQTEPLVPDISKSLLAVDRPTELDRVFDTAAPLGSGRWTSIYIHQSRTASGNADTLTDGVGQGPVDDGLSDHFVIGNGDGCADGAIQVGERWDQQRSAGKLAGVDHMRPDCISVCLIGDFDQARPTPNQLRGLQQLVEALQQRLKIGAKQVWLLDSTGTAGIGSRFPLTDFRAGLQS